LLIGPFADDDSAGDWATANNPSDDPRWQVLGLSDPHAPIEVVAPEAGPIPGEPDWEERLEETRRMIAESTAKYDINAHRAFLQRQLAELDAQPE
jgi:hypothetical protein